MSAASVTGLRRGSVRDRRGLADVVVLAAVAMMVATLTPTVGRESGVVGPATASTDVEVTATQESAGPAGVREAVAAGGDVLAGTGLRFELNAGQFDEEVAFRVQAGGYQAFLQDDGQVIFALDGGQGPAGRLTMTPVGVSDHPMVEGLDQLPGVTNYLYGDDRAEWITGVAGYRKVAYRGVWPGIDVKFYEAEEGWLEYDFVVAPGADPDRIALAFHGAQDLSVTDSGQLHIQTPAGTVRKHASVAYQEQSGTRNDVASRFTTDQRGRVSFELGNYDPTQPLIIDPAVEFSTYLGGSQGFDPVTGEQTSASRDAAHAVAVGNDGTVYVAGVTETGDFPTAHATQPQKSTGSDAFVAAFTADGQELVYATFLGGDSEDHATGMTTGLHGSVWVAGRTYSSDFPVTANAYDPGCDDLDVQCQATRSAESSNAFVTRLNPLGAIDYSTYLAGGDYDSAEGVSLDPVGRAVVVGETHSADDGTTPTVDEGFPTTDGAMQSQLSDPEFEFQTDGFVSVVDATRSGESSLAYSTYFGGDVQDEAIAVAVDGADPASVFIAGTTRSADLGASSTVYGDLGSRDAFVAALAWDGSSMVLEWTRYLGGHASEEGLAVAVAEGCSANCDAWVGGSSRSFDNPDNPDSEPYPTTSGAIQRELAGGSDGFLTRVTADGSELVWSTYLGGAGVDKVSGVAVTPAGRLWATGWTRSSDFHVVDPVAVRQSLRDAFLTEVDPAGKLLSSSYLGGADDDVGNAVAATPVAGVVVVGRTESIDFPTMDPFQTDHARGEDAFVTRVAPHPPGAPVVAGLDPPGGPPSGGTTVEVVGHGFTQDAIVEFGRRRADVVHVDDSGDRLVAVSPPHPEGKGAVTVTTQSGTSPANPISVFTYLPGFWRTVGEPATRRPHAAATLLGDGRILLTGGRIDRTIFDDADLYDPLDRSWTRLDSTMTEPRFGHTATLLPSGDVLIVGGRFTERSAGLFDSNSGDFTSLDPPGRGHNRHTATLLTEPGCEPRCGHVLVTAGFGGGGGDTESEMLAAELYDPENQDWTFTGAMNGPTQLHTATVLAGPECREAGAPSYCGDVLVVSGACVAYTSTDCAEYAPTLGSQTKRVEAYDPATNEWRSLEDAHANRLKHSAALLPDGRLKVMGGFFERSSGGGVALDSSEIYDPALDEWEEPGQLQQARGGHGMVSLPDGRLFVAGGGPTLSELYEDGRWRPAQPTLSPHTDGHQNPRQIHAVLLSSNPFGFAADAAVCGFDCGKVLLVGGLGGDRQTAAEHVELFTPPPTVTGIEAAGGGPLTGSVEGGATLELSGFGFTHHIREVRFGEQATVPCPLPEPAVANGTVPTWPQDGPCRITGYDTLEVDVPALQGSTTSVPVTVVNEGGAATAPQEFTYIGLPGAVQDLLAKATGPRAIDLSWSAAGSTGPAGPPATDYVVKQARTPITSGEDFQAATALCGGVCDASVLTPAPGQVGDEVTLTVTGLQPSTKYHYAVRAVDPDTGEQGPLSNPAQATTPPDTVAPGGVVDLAAQAASESAIELTWSLPGDDGQAGPPVDEFVIKQSTTAFSDQAGFAAATTLCNPCGPDVLEISGGQAQVTVTDLASSTRYWYAVKPVDGAGNRGPMSNVAEATTLGVGQARRGVVRLAGPDRIATAVAASRDRFADDSAGGVVLARGGVFADGLAGVPLALDVGGPLLLTGSDRLDDRAAGEIDRVLPHGGTVYLLGGRKALSRQVEDELAGAGYAIRRLWGPDRYATAVAIADFLGDPQAVLLATGTNFADAAAAGAAAARAGGVVLLTAGERLPEVTANYLAGHEGVARFAAGGPAARADRQARPLVGLTRFETAVKVAQAFFTDPRVVGVATGHAFADALSGGAHIAALGGPLLLAQPHQLPGEVDAYLSGDGQTATGAVIYGGPAALSRAVADQLAAALD